MLFSVTLTAGQKLRAYEIYKRICPECKWDRNVLFAQGEPPTKGGTIIDVANNKAAFLVSSYSGGWHSLKHYLVGVDEGAAYKTRVPSTCKTVKAALDWLRPALSRRRGAIRQGDMWFAPVSKMVEQRLNKYSDSEGDYYLFETPHRCHGQVVRTRRALYAKGIVYAPDHAHVVLDSWHEVRPNNRRFARFGFD